MMNANQVFGPVHTGLKAPAIYNKLVEQIYRHNCFIEALPLLPQTEEERFRWLTVKPIYSESERHESAGYRKMAVERLAKFRLALPASLKTLEKIDRALRNGYSDRNPLEAERIKQLNSGFPGLVKGNAGESYNRIPCFSSGNNGYGLFGASGVGKTSMVEAALNCYPQVIVHTSYNRRPFDQQQLVWLKLDCPIKGSSRGLCFDFAFSVDSVLGTDFYPSFARLNADGMLAKMAQIAAAIGLGILVIDEIQRLSESYSGGENALLNFFVKLANTVRIPVLLMGTYKSLNLFSTQFSSARRIAGQGDQLISHMSNGREWKFFLEKLWRYQFTACQSPLTEEIANAMYAESQGLIDLAVKLYMMTQWQVIGSCNEAITPDLIEKTAAANFNAARPMLQALRNKDYERLAEIEDLVPHDQDLNSFMKNSASRVIISGSDATMGNLQMAAEKPGSGNWGMDPVAEIVSRLVQVGIEQSCAKQFAEIAIKRNEKEIDVTVVTQEALRMALASHASTDSTEVSPRPAKRDSLPPHPADLRVVAIKGGKKGENTAYSNLNASGTIKSPDEFL